VTGDFAIADHGHLYPASCRKAFRGGALTVRPTPTVFVPIEGKGRSRIGDDVFEWGPRDIFVVPSWRFVTHEVAEDAVLFSYSDRPIQQKLDLWREDRGNA